jgi:hypothetical protein
MAESNQTDWRELCAAAATEADSERLADLVDQIIKALDERGELFTSPKQFDKIPSRESNIAKRLSWSSKKTIRKPSRFDDSTLRFLVRCWLDSTHQYQNKRNNRH